ncbi:ERICH2 family protein [Megaselia abdita]
MSKSFFMDESNGNGLFSIKTTKISSGNGGDNIQLPTSLSSDDLSQSLSEYTDADESISAPTEFLAEFLSAVMQKDYKKAFEYCKLILHYEPNNTTAKEFYPLIKEKLNCICESDENCNKSSSSPEMGDDLSNEEEIGVCIIDEAEDEHSSSDGIDGVVEEEECDDDGDGCSTSTSESECEDEQEISSEFEGNNLDVLRNSRNSSASGSARSRSDNTTHSYSSLLLEEEDDIVSTNLPLHKDISSPNLDLNNGMISIFIYFFTGLANVTCYIT